VERLINNNSMVTQLWNAITPNNPENGGNMFSKTSVPTRATWYKVLGDIYRRSGIFWEKRRLITSVSQNLFVQEVIFLMP
jgi:hypothetical protein